MYTKLVSPFQSKPFEVGDMVVCRGNRHVFRDAMCIQHIGTLWDIHPSCSGILLNIWENEVKIYFGEDLFAIPQKSCILHQHDFEIVKSDKLCIDLCHYFNYLCSDREDKQLQMFQEERFLKSDISISFNKKRWSFEVELSDESYGKIIQKHREYGREFPEVVEYFSPLGTTTAKVLNYFLFNTPSTRPIRKE